MNNIPALVVVVVAAAVDYWVVLRQRKTDVWKAVGSNARVDVFVVGPQPQA